MSLLDQIELGVVKTEDQMINEHSSKIKTDHTDSCDEQALGCIQVQEKSEIDNTNEQILRDILSSETAGLFVSHSSNGFVCSECQRSFRKCGRLKTHMELVHNMKIEYYPTCNICQQTFASYKGLKRHIEAVHMKLKKFSCEECQRLFSKKGHLKTHIETAHLRFYKFPCGECKRSFAQSNHLKTHVETVHLNLYKFECYECHHSFSEQSSLKKHVERGHKNKMKKYTCCVCGVVLFGNVNLKKHMDDFHKKMFFCNECVRSFVNSKALKRHLQFVHSKDKRCICDICQSWFSRKEGVKLHIQSRHLKIKHKCDKCERAFSQIGYLRRHKETIHRNAEILKIEQVEVIINE